MNPDKYKSIGNGFAVTVKEDGVRGLAKGWAPTFIGYSMQGLCKFGFYEVFKILYSDLLGEVRATVVRATAVRSEALVAVEVQAAHRLEGALLGQGWVLNTCVCVCV